MNDKLTLKELFALIMRRGKFILITAIVLAIVFGLGKGIIDFINASKNKADVDAITKEHNQNLQDYENGKLALEQQIATGNSYLHSQEEYNAHSLLMTLDPFAITITTINFAISGIDKSDTPEIISPNEIPIDYKTSKILDQYLALWCSMDLQTELRDIPYANYADKYLRELISFERIDGDILSIRVIGDSADTTQKLATAVFKCLEENQEVVAAGSYSHTFSLIGQTTKVEIDLDLINIQQSNLEKIQSYQESISELESKYELLIPPEMESEYFSASETIKSIVKYAILGFLFGIVISFTIALVVLIFSNRVESSQALTKTLSVSFLGSVAKYNSVFQRIANSILGEQMWSSSSSAFEYLSENIAARFVKTSRILIISTLPIDNENPTVKEIISSAAKKGISLTFAGDINNNPKASSAIINCDQIVLAERPGVSLWRNIFAASSLTKDLKKEISGYIAI